MEPSDGDATVTVQKVKGVEKVSMPVVANGKTKRVNVYWETDASEAQVKITVTAAGSGKTDYFLPYSGKKTFRHQHLQKYRRCSDHGKRSLQPRYFHRLYRCVPATRAARKRGPSAKKGAPTIKVTATRIKLKVKQSTSK